MGAVFQANTDINTGLTVNPRTLSNDRLIDRLEKLVHRKSRFQLQIDHRRSVWAGGGNEPENLQILCSVHNALKFARHF